MLFLAIAPSIFFVFDILVEKYVLHISIFILRDIGIILQKIITNLTKIMKSFFMLFIPFNIETINAKTIINTKQHRLK